MSPQVTYLTDVNSSEMDDSCPMKTWHSRFEGGRGIEPKEGIVTKRILEETHADLRMLANLEDLSAENIQRICNEAVAGLTDEDYKDRQKMEFLYRRLGWFAAFATFIEPTIRGQYENVPCDSEVVLDHDPLWVIATPDRLLKHRATDELLYREYVLMPASLTNRKWLQQWHYNIRAHIGMAATEDAMKVKVTFGQIMGLSEGYISTIDARLVHPYVYGYHRGDEWSPNFKTEDDGWKRAPIWEFTGGIVNWVTLCGRTMAENQFPFSPYIIKNAHLVDEWCARRLSRERTIRNMTDVAHTNYHIRGLHFQKHTSQCKPADGSECQFLKACWNPELKVNPFKSGDYIPNLIPLTEVKV